MPSIDVDIVKIEKKQDTQLILGHAGFIKTAEDLYEAMVNAVPSVKFGLAFAEASGPCLVRSEGNDEQLTRQAEQNMLRIGAGHSFIILFEGAYPINVLNSIKHVNEVTRVYCATSNPVEVLVAKTGLGRSIIGVVDGSASKGIEKSEDKASRRKLLRSIGYKLG
ncbi:MAG: adenosine-specific kinase [Candidatus Micrarchaeia archaeon]